MASLKLKNKALKLLSLFKSWFIIFLIRTIVQISFIRMTFFLIWIVVFFVVKRLLIFWRFYVVFFKGIWNIIGIEIFSFSIIYIARLDAAAVICIFFFTATISFALVYWVTFAYGLVFCILIVVLLRIVLIVIFLVFVSFIRRVIEVSAKFGLLVI